MNSIVVPERKTPNDINSDSISFFSSTAPAGDGFSVELVSAKVIESEPIELGNAREGHILPVSRKKLV